MFPPAGRLRHQVWWHILYTRGRKQKKRRPNDEDRRSQRQRQSEKERKRERDKPLLSWARRAYCVILATVAAATAGIIIISKGGQNTGPESHNAEFYDFWHRGDATGCNAAFYTLLTAPDLISRPEMDGFSKRLSDHRRIRSAVIERIRKCRRTRGTVRGRNKVSQQRSCLEITPRRFREEREKIAFQLPRTVETR